MNLTELFTPKIIAANYTEAASNAIPYLGSGLFPSVKRAGLDLAWIKGHKGLPVSLKPSAFDAKATFRDRIGVSKLETEMPFFREGYKIKSTDASGMPQPLRVFDYSERTASQKQPTHTAQKPKEEYVTRQEFNALTARFDALTADKPLTRKKKEADNEQPSV